MRTLRHFFIADSLDEVAKVEEELKQHGVSSAQFHVLSQDSAGMEKRGLNSLHTLLRRDMWLSGWIGAATGAVLAGLILLVSGVLGLAASAAGWFPFLFLAIVAFGFCTWEGGFYGIQKPNRAFTRFAEDLEAGRHIIFVDTPPAEKERLLNMVKDHDGLSLKRTEAGRSAWLIRLIDKWRGGVDRNLLSQEQF